MHVVIACPSCSAPSTRVLELEADQDRAKLACRVCGAQWYEVVVPIPEAAKE